MTLITFAFPRLHRPRNALATGATPKMRKIPLASKYT